MSHRDPLHLLPEPATTPACESCGFGAPLTTINRKEVCVDCIDREPVSVNYEVSNEILDAILAAGHGEELTQDQRAALLEMGVHMSGQVKRVRDRVRSLMSGMGADALVAS